MSTDMGRRRRRQALRSLTVATFTSCAFVFSDADAANANVNDSGSTGTGIGLCQGGCQSHDDCLPGLVCYRRNSNDPAIERDDNIVPGCSSAENSDKLAEIQDGINYCITPSQNFTHLTYIAQRGPMGTCAGDCEVMICIG